jgi:hypothetical protein
MKKIIFILVLWLSAISAYSQGCSDAGFCSAGGLNGNGINHGENDMRNEVKLTLAYEVGEQGTQFFIPQAEGLFMLDEDNVVQIKIPYQIASGNLGTNQGLGDFIASFAHRFYSKNNWKMSATFGVRIASGNANNQLDDKSLPMPYQTSLGTYDGIFGMSLQYKTWLLSGGVQIPLSQQNDNAYNPLDFPNESAYYLSRELERKADVMLRLEKAFAFDAGYVKLGVLPIYHVANDTYLQQDSLGIASRVEAVGSQGVTINLIAAGRYEIKEHWAVEFAGGIPVMVRDNRPDGLTRSLVLRPSVVYRF